MSWDRPEELSRSFEYDFLVFSNHQASGILDRVGDDVKILREKYVRKSRPNTRMELTAIYAHKRTVKDVH
jgi:hypothetical protein